MTNENLNTKVSNSGKSSNNGNNKPFYRKDNSKNHVRKNEKIRAREVRVIDNDGKQLGILPINEAIILARSRGLDLIEISPNAQPPVCKILNFGKFQYDESKKNKQSSKSQTTKIKEIKLRIGIDQNDYNTKIRHAIEFLEKGFKLKITLMFRGRELSRTEFGFEVIQRFISDLKVYGSVDFEPKLFGKMISVTISPLSAQKKLAQAQQKKEAQPVKVLNASELLKL